MARDGADAIVADVTRIADYDALRDVANQLAGLLVARQRAAGGNEEAAAPWREEHRALRARLDQIRPGTPAVAAALQEWSGRLAALRQAGV